MTETNNDHFWIYKRIKEIDKEINNYLWIYERMNEIDKEIAQKRHEKAFLESLLQKDSPCIFKSKSSDTSIFHNEKY